MKKFLSLILTLALILSVCSFAAADDLPTITIMFHGSNVSDDSAVLEKVNEYIADKVGAKLEVIWGTWGDFDEKAVNALTSGDKDVDIVFTCSWSSDEYNSYAKKGYFLKLDDLIEQYGADLKAAIPESLMQAATIEGAEGKGVYAVNGFKDTATQNTWDVNVTLLTELGYTVDDLMAKGFFGWDEIFAKAKEVKGDSFYPFLVEPMVAERMVTNSIIVAGDAGSTNLLSLYLNPEDVSADGIYGNKLVNKFGTPEYKAFAEQMHKYYEAGYIDPALSVGETSNDCRTNHQKDASYLIGTQSYAFGYEYSADVLARGAEIKFVPCTDPYVDTTASQGAMMAINSASEHPEEAFKFLALLNSDPTLMTLMNYGVEGIHYTLNDEAWSSSTMKPAPPTAPGPTALATSPSCPTPLPKARASVSPSRNTTPALRAFLPWASCSTTAPLKMKWLPWATLLLSTPWLWTAVLSIPRLNCPPSWPLWMLPEWKLT